MVPTRFAALDLPIELPFGYSLTENRLLILITLAAAVVLTGQRTSWRLLRFVVTIAHEGGHAVVAVMMRRELAGIRLHSDTSGVTLSRGRAAGPGMVFTAGAGYPAPSLIGAGFAVLVAFDHIRVMLWLTLVLLVLLLIQIRNVFGAVTVVGTGAAAVAVIIWGDTRTALGFACAVTWLLLVGGLRAVIELQRSRHDQGSGRGRRQNLQSDADQLARLTHLPGILWVTLFFLLSLAALLASAWLMLR
jgi:Peptidase M50B-like